MCAVCWAREAGRRVVRFPYKAEGVHDEEKGEGYQGNTELAEGGR